MESYNNTCIFFVVFFNLSQPIFVFELQGSSCSIKVKHGDHVIDVIYGGY